MPAPKNLCLSFVGNESFLKEEDSFNNFPIGLMILEKIESISCRMAEDSSLDSEDSEELDLEIKLNYINQNAKDLFELKENDNSSKIINQLKQFNLVDNNINENLFSLLYNQKEQIEYYGAFKNKEILIWVKLIIKKNKIYICSDYFSDDRKFIQNELFQSIKYQYIATLFHELYNPMNCILVMMENNKNDDIFKTNLDHPNYPTEIIGSHFTLITENELEKINNNLNLNDVNNNINEQNDINNIHNNYYSILLNKYEKCLRLEEFYKSKYIYMKERENDIRVLVNIIYVFLENLILYLRLNLGDGKNTNKNILSCLSENDSYLFEEDNNQKNIFNLKKDTFLTYDKRNSKSEIKSKENNKINIDLTSQLYQDNYLNSAKANKKVNLKIIFLKHLKKFFHLFKFKKIQYFKDFNFLSNKYILTDESIFSDFISQFYSFLYYVVPKSNGFIILFNIVKENKIKLTVNKQNYDKKKSYTQKRYKKKDSFILLGNHFKAVDTVKTIEMTIEIMQKLAKMLGITLKIMDYLEDTEEKYLTILMPFHLGKDIDKKESEINIDSSEEDIDDNMKDNFIFENTFKSLEKIDLNDLENDKLIEMRNKTKKIMDNINAKINTNTKSNKRLSLFAENKGKDKILSNINNGNKIINNNIINNTIKNVNNVNININFNENININNNSNNRTISPLISNNNNKNISLNSFNEDNLSSLKNNPNNIEPIEKEKNKNILTLIHEKYSFIDRLKRDGVEIFNEKEKNFKYEYKNINTEQNIEKNKDKNSLKVELDTENYFEIENDNEDTNEEIIYNENYNNINLKIGEDYLNMYKNKENDSLTKNNKNKNLIKPKEDSIKPILKTKRRNSDKRSQSFNKTLIYDKVEKKIFFIIPEIEDIEKKVKIHPHPSSKLNNKYLNDFNFCDCNDILLVDDDEFICKAFKNILSRFKLGADFASNGLECINMIKEKIEKNCTCEKNKYKIIFMDITMPVMDGIEASKKIQQMIDNKELYDDIKIIFISAHANIDLSATMSGIKCAIDYHAKPISADKYKELLNKYYY